MSYSSNTPTRNWNFSSWWSGKSPVVQDTDDSDGEFQTPGGFFTPSTGNNNRRYLTRSGDPRSAKKRKTTDEGFGESGTPMSLEQLASSLRRYHATSEERQKRAEERERKSEARAQRIESLLKRVLDNQKKLLSKENNDDNDSDSEVEAGNRPIDWRSPGGGGIRYWSEKERKLVVLGLALYGKDKKAICDLLEKRNRNQINGFFARNEFKLVNESKKYRNRTAEDKAALLQEIKFVQNGEKGEESEEEGDKGEEVEDNAVEDSGEGTGYNQGVWMSEEIAQLMEGVALHGTQDYGLLSSFVKTRSRSQTRMYVYRHLKQGYEEAPKNRNDLFMC